MAVSKIWIMIAILKLKLICVLIGGLRPSGHAEHVGHVEPAFVFVIVVANVFLVQFSNYGSYGSHIDHRRPSGDIIDHERDTLLFVNQGFFEDSIANQNHL